jgi:hypothetical protein
VQFVTTVFMYLPFRFICKIYPFSKLDYIDVMGSDIFDAES